MVKRFLLSLLLLASSVWAQAQNVPPTVSMFTSSVIGIAHTTITLNANASDQDGQIVKVDFYNGTTLLGTVTQKQPPCTTYCLAWPNVQAGVYNLTAVATDNLGASTTSAAFTTMVFAPPTVAIATPANNASYAAPASITFTANAADADGTVTKVEYLNGTTVIGTATAAPYSVTWSNVAVGSYVITARATDNTGIKTTSATVNVTVSANQAPTVTLEANPASTPAPGNVMLSANVADSDGAVAKVEFFNGVNLLATITQAPFAYNWLNIPAGTYALTAKATDNGGMETTSNAVTVTVAQGPAQAYYIHADHLNTPRLITDQAGNKVWEWENTDPFGGNAANEDPNDTGAKLTFNLRFPGQYFDKETGLHYNYFRDYDPATGRYVQSDPIGLNGGINTYGYVGGNPASYTDPLGLQAMARASGAAMGIPGSLSPTGKAAARALDKAAAEAKSNLPAALCRTLYMACAAVAAANAVNQSNQDSENICPPVPGDLVGDQSDPRAGKRGKRHTSGPLLPEYGGTGNGEKDFEHLTGGTGRPFPPGNTYPPGSLQGENGVTYRPGKPGEGPRIDIPGNGSKPPETLHY